MLFDVAAINEQMEESGTGKPLPRCLRFLFIPITVKRALCIGMAI